jgi:hypothetical protein
MRPIAAAALAACALACAAAAGAHQRPHDGRVGALATHGPDRARTAMRPLRAAAPRAPAAWCGEERSTDDSRAEADRSGHRFHAVYAVPADGTSRLREVAPTLQADAQAASDTLVARRGRAIRLDRGTRCGRRFLDITTLRLRLTTARLERLAETPDGVLDAVAAELDRAGRRTARSGETPRGVAGRTNYLVWLDGPAPPRSCGQAAVSLDRRRSPANDNNSGGRVAAIFRDGAGFCGPVTVLHEIGHTLGAVQPRTPAGRWTGHCDDSPLDVMCEADGSPALGGLEIDAGHDDYWDPPTGAPLPHWTLNLSRFLCPDATCRPGRRGAGAAERLSRYSAVVTGPGRSRSRS